MDGRFRNGSRQTWVCDWIYGQNIAANCYVDPEFVVVGGGGEIFGQQSPGALLTASYPLWDSAWEVKSKDHEYPYPHYLRAYALGMRIDGLDRNNLRDWMVFDEMDVSADYWNESYFYLQDPDYMIVGGGARVNYGTGPGRFLIGTIGYGGSPDSWGYWGAAHRDLVYASPGNVTIYTIALKKCIDSVGCFTSSNGWYEGSSRGYGYRTVSGAVPDGFAMTSLGGYAGYVGSTPQTSRFLTDINPTFVNGVPGVFVSTKDHSYTNWGYAIAEPFGLRRD